MPPDAGLGMLDVGLDVRGTGLGRLNLKLDDRGTRHPKRTTTAVDGFTKISLAIVGLCSFTQEKANYSEMTGGRRKIKRRAGTMAGSSPLNVCSGIEQLAGNGLPPQMCRKVQRSHVTYPLNSARLVRLGTGSEKA